MKKFCETCAILNPKLLKCQLFGHQVNPKEDYCSKHTESLLTCGFCGGAMDKEHSILQFKNDTYVRTVCERCNSLTGTCQLCKHGGKCLFETDPSPLPKVVEKVFRQGPMTTVTQIRNPERIEITCKKGCPCYDPENECLKQFNTCGKCEDI